MIITSGFLTALECTTFLARALPQTLLGELTALPRLRMFKRVLLLRKEREGEGRRGKDGRKRGVYEASFLDSHLPYISTSAVASHSCVLSGHLTVDGKVSFSF